MRRAFAMAVRNLALAFLSVCGESACAEGMRTFISVGETNVDLNCTWTPGTVRHGYVEAATSTNVSTLYGWDYICGWPVSSNDTNVAVSIARNTSEPQRFWRFSSWSDGDGDGLSEQGEYSLYMTDPRRSDTDGDGLPDDFEVNLGTDPNVPDYALAPRVTVGVGGDFPDIRSALTVASPYMVIEMLPGVYRWSMVHLPSVPVLIASPDGGRNRQVVVRGTSGGAYLIGATNAVRSVLRGLTFDISASGENACVWIGGNLPWDYLSSYGAGSVRVENCLFRLSGRVPSVGLSAYLYTPELLVVSDCIFDASCSPHARGCRLYNSNPVVLERCSFIGFPAVGGREGACGVWYGSSVHWLPDGNPVIPVSLKSCLFDDSFSAASPLATDTDATIYSVALMDCLMPTTNTLAWSGDPMVRNLILATNTVSRYGLLPAGSSAIDAGGPVSSGAFDVKGEDRDAHPDIGAAEYVADSDPDTDGDGIVDSQEGALGTDPFLFDTDFDGVWDLDEVGHGANPTNAVDFCFSLTVSVTNPVPQHSYAKLAYFTSVSNSIPMSEPVAITNAYAIVEMPHLHVTNGAPPVLAMWADVDGDGLFAAPEHLAWISYTVSHHTNHVESAVPTALYDADDDGVPDRWEIEHFLSHTNAADALVDLDGDGLLNLHEYWADCDPHVYDGADTAIYAAVHSIDDRLADTNSTGRLRYYSVVSAESIVTNPHCWAAGICLSSQSPHNSHSAQLKAGTAISPYHIVFAKHYHIDAGSRIHFYGNDGSVVTNILLESRQVLDTDIRVGILSNALDVAIVPAAKILPVNYSAYLGNMMRLPVAVLNQFDDVLVKEIRDSALQTMNFVDHPAVTRRVPYTDYIIDHDSGNPAYLLVGDEPVLIFVLYGGINNVEGLDKAFWGARGESLNRYADDIQATMDVLSDGRGLPRQQLQYFDLSNYMPLSNWR